MYKKLVLLLILTVTNIIMISNTEVKASVDPGGGGGLNCADYKLGYDSVDSGNNIHWDGGTVYISNLGDAIDTWNSKNEVNIAPDTIWVIQDIAFSDVDRSDVTWAGQYSYFFGTIKFNKHYMENYNSDRREMVAVHELGHALGLAHSYTGNIMISTVTDQTTLGAMDHQCYNELWD